MAGLTVIQGLEIIRGCKGLNVVGGEVVEVMVFDCSNYIPLLCSPSCFNGPMCFDVIFIFVFLGVSTIWSIRYNGTSSCESSFWDVVHFAWGSVWVILHKLSSLLTLSKTLLGKRKWESVGVTSNSCSLVSPLTFIHSSSCTYGILWFAWPLTRVACMRVFDVWLATRESADFQLTARLSPTRQKHLPCPTWATSQTHAPGCMRAARWSGLPLKMFFFDWQICI